MNWVRCSSGSETRGRAFGIWNISIPIGALLAGPLSGLVLSYSNWHVMLMLEGLPAWIWALVWWRSIPDSPQSAAWLTAEERGVLLGGLAAEQAEFDAGLRGCGLGSR